MPTSYWRRGKHNVRLITQDSGFLREQLRGKIQKLPPPPPSKCDGIFNRSCLPHSAPAPTAPNCSLSITLRRWSENRSMQASPPVHSPPSTTRYRCLPTGVTGSRSRRTPPGFGQIVLIG